MMEFCHFSQLTKKLPFLSVAMSSSNSETRQMVWDETSLALLLYKYSEAQYESIWGPASPFSLSFLSGSFWAFFLKPSPTLRVSDPPWTCHQKKNRAWTKEKHNKEFFLKSGSVSDRYENACEVFWLERLFSLSSSFKLFGRLSFLICCICSVYFSSKNHTPNKKG